MITYECKSKRFGTIFLRGDPRLVEEVRLEILVEAAEMFLGKERKRKVKGDDYEGVLRTEGKYAVIGCHSGQEFYATLDTRFGKSEISFLVSKYHDPRLN